MRCIGFGIVGEIVSIFCREVVDGGLSESNFCVPVGREDLIVEVEGRET